MDKRRTSIMRRDFWAKEISAELLNKHPKALKNWKPKWHLEIWLRDECRCVYCGRNLLQDRDITYFFYCYDHLLPKEKEKYAALRTETWNKVLACRACNSWKSTFDPAGEDVPATEEYKDKLIERAKKYIQERRS